jgi:cytochrome b subunit of formate dehydrogenase
MVSEGKSRIEVPVLVCFLLSLLSVCAGIAHAAAVSNDDCVVCHGEKDLTGKGPGGTTVSLYFDTGTFKKSTHAALNCVDCHTTIKEVPHAEKLPPVNCASCHEGSLQQYGTSVHSKEKVSCTTCHGYHGVQPAGTLSNALCATCHAKSVHDYQAGIHARKTAGEREPATCADCHGETHRALAGSSPKSPTNRADLSATCLGCHAAKQTGVPAYADAVHDKVRTRWKDSSLPVCSDCHGSHAIKPASEPASQTSPPNVAATCGPCHRDVAQAFEKSIHGREVKRGNENAPGCTTCHAVHGAGEPKAAGKSAGAMQECGTCHARQLETYRHTYHGKIASLGFTRVARCADCHTTHEILPASDPASTVSRARVLETCRKCHPDANRNFAAIMVHADYRDKSEGGLYYVWLFMTVLLCLVFGFFGIHTLLWLPRSWIERMIRPAKEKGTASFVRLNLFHRTMHVVVAVSFMGLAVTGLPLKFAESQWARWLIHLMGSFETAGGLHQFFAAVTFGYFVAHLVYLTYFFRCRSKEPFFAFLIGPNSMLPRLKDVQDLGNNVRWFLGRGPRPDFDRWTYWEKFDYWAVFWGVGMIGVSGLFLWFPTFFARFLPGWVLNVATIIHSDEALLATGFIFIFHYIHTHLRGEKFPLDPVIFAGRITEEEFRAERPAEYRRLREEKRLEDTSTTHTPSWLYIVAHLAGFVALAIGIGTIVLVIHAIVRH